MRADFCPVRRPVLRDQDDEASGGFVGVAVAVEQSFAAGVNDEQRVALFRGDADRME
jgi:hypothetical protein